MPTHWDLGVTTREARGPNQTTAKLEQKECLSKRLQLPFPCCCPTPLGKQPTLGQEKRRLGLLPQLRPHQVLLRMQQWYGWHKSRMLKT